MNFLKATLFFLLLATSWLAGGAEGTRNRLLDGKDPLGSPGELAWQAWLMMDSPATNGGGGGGSGPGGSVWESMNARRITPKSIFFTTSDTGSSSDLKSCPVGTLPDINGKCLPAVNPVSAEEVNMSILIQRMNSIAMLLAARGGESSGSPFSGDSGPFKVRLAVPPATSTTTSTSAPSSTSTSSSTTEEATTVAASSTTTTTTTTPPPPPAAASSPAPSPPIDPASPGDSGDEPVEVSVVMADVTKRNSGEDERKSEDNDEAKPALKTETDKKIPVANVTSSSSAEDTFPTTEVTSVEDKKSNAKEGPSLSSYDVAPAVVEGVLPLLIKSNPVHVATTPPPDDDIVLEDAEGSGASVDGPEAEALDEMGALNSDYATSTEHTDDSGTTVRETDDERETGSADVMEHIEVVPISENSRHKLPILSEDQDTSFSQGGLAGLIHPVPLDIIRNTQSKEDVPYNNPIRFPSESSSEPHTVHLFKGNYIKFPTEHVYRYKNKPVTDQLPEVKQSFWWFPSGWRADHQRHQPTLQDYWSRMPLSEDQPLHRRYNPLYPAPLPYQQRQAQYDPEWASMKRQMSS